MTAADWKPVIDAIIGGLALILTSVVVPWAILAFQERTKIQLTDQQRATVLGAAQTAAGIIQTKIDQGLLSVQDIHPSNPVVRQEAAAAVARVPDSAAALGTTADTMAAIVVGRVDTSAAPVVAPASAALPVTLTEVR